LADGGADEMYITELNAFKPNHQKHLHERRKNEMGRRKHIIHTMFLVFFILFPGVTASGVVKEGVSPSELQEVVNLIEDPQKREPFLKELKAFINVKEAATNRGVAERTVVPEKKIGKYCLLRAFFHILKRSPPMSSVQRRLRHPWSQRPLMP
jgi:hypothetical protein